MDILYIDNYRGFESTFLPLENVNFFLGENSSGKTSILKLIGILNSSKFWNYQEFGMEIGLGNFYEIITKDSCKSHFEVALFKDNHNTFSIIKFKFIELNNLPYIKEISIWHDNINIQASIDGKTIKYRHNIKEIDRNLTDIEVFKEWLEDSSLYTDKFLKADIYFIGVQAILFQLQGLIANTNREALLSSNLFIKDLIWTMPIRSKPRKSYEPFLSSSDSDAKNSPYKLKNIWTLENERVKSILRKFGSDSGLYDDIKIISLTEQSEKTGPFQIQFSLAGKDLNITSVGYGVSQILPFLVDVVEKSHPSLFAVQQPEVHLHPRAQAAVGDFIFKSCEIDKHMFIVETHSDYTVDRFRFRINKQHKEDSNKKSNSQVLFFSTSEKGNRVAVIPIRDDGSFPEDQPREFRDFFLNEQLNLISI